MVTANNVVDALKRIGCRNQAAFDSLIKSWDRVNELLDKAGVTDKALWWAFAVGQGAHESTLFSKTEENLYYRAERLVQVFPSKFKSVAAAAPYARNPQKMAEYVYGTGTKARDLGNTTALDGWLFRGSSFVQLTGRSNFTVCDNDLKLGIVEYPDRARDIANAWIIFAWYMTKRTYAGKPMYYWMQQNNITYVTRAVTGGSIGLSERRDYTTKMAAALKAVTGNATVTAQSVELDKGDYGPQVRELQTMLWEADCPCGKIDGDFGVNTERAVKQFQTVQKLPVTGKVDTATWNALRTATN